MFPPWMMLNKGSITLIRPVRESDNMLLRFTMAFSSLKKLENLSKALSSIPNMLSIGISVSTLLFPLLYPVFPRLDKDSLVLFIPLSMRLRFEFRALSWVFPSSEERVPFSIAEVTSPICSSNIFLADVRLSRVSDSSSSCVL